MASLLDFLSSQGFLGSLGGGSFYNEPDRPMSAQAPIGPDPFNFAMPGYSASAPNATPQPPPMQTMPVSMNTQSSPMPPQQQEPYQPPPPPANLGGFMGALQGFINPEAPFKLRQQEQDQQVVYRAARAANIPHAQALLLATNPDAQKQLFSQNIEQQKLDKPVVVPYGAELIDPSSGKPINPEGTSGGLQDQAKDVAEAIKSGRQPPVLTGLYRVGPAVRSVLEKGGFNLANAQVEWTRAQKQIQALNGPQMTRFVGLADSVDKTIDEVRELSKQMQLSGIPKLNAVELGAYIQTMGNTPNGQLATRYIGAVNTLKEEFANLANGGYAPTEPAWKLANEQINSHYGDKQMDAALTEVQRLIRYRRQAIPNIDTLGPGAANRYAPSSTTAPSAPASQAPAAAEAQTPADNPIATPSPPAIQALRANPKLVPQFEAKFGKGSAAKYLNTRPTLQM